MMLSVCLSVPYDLTNSSTIMIVLYIEASYKCRAGYFAVFWGRYLYPPIINRHENMFPTPKKNLG